MYSRRDRKKYITIYNIKKLFEKAVKGHIEGFGKIIF